MKALIDGANRFVRNTTLQEEGGELPPNWQLLDDPYEGELISPVWNGSDFEIDERVERFYRSQIRWEDFEEWLKDKGFFQLAFQHATAKDFAAFLFAIQQKDRRLFIQFTKRIVSSLKTGNHINNQQINALKNKIQEVRLSFNPE